MKGRNTKKESSFILISQQQAQGDSKQQANFALLQDNQKFDSAMNMNNIGSAQMQKLSQIITNLVIKNKVNAKNAFNVPIIDVTSMGAIKQNDDNSWSKISNVLENSSKIYGYRVDFMADVINKMTNNISRSQKSNQIDLIQKDKVNKHKNTHSQMEDTSIKQTFNIDSIFDQEQQVYSIHIQKQKNINRHAQQKNLSVSHLSTRRMFDQNGISGLLLSKLPISKNLNIIIDLNIDFAGHQLKKCQNISQKNVSMHKNTEHVMIFQEIQSFQKCCFQSQNSKDQMLIDCYNVDFGNQIENVLCQQNQNYQNDFDFLQAPNQDDFNKHQQYDGTQNNILSTDNNSLSNFSILIEPFYQKNNGKMQTNKAIKLKKQKKNKKQRKKQQSFIIDFQSSLTNNRQSILSIQTTGNIKKDKYMQRKPKDKHVYKCFVPQFKMQKQVVYPIYVQANDSKNVVSNQNIFEQGNCNSAISQLSQTQILFKAPHIKATKNWLWQNISTKYEYLLSQLHTKYQKNKGPVSQAILFLAVLHLGNQKNLIILQQNSFQILIKNPNYLNIQQN